MVGCIGFLMMVKFKRKDRLVINYLRADRWCNFSLCNNEWSRLKTQYGF